MESDTSPTAPRFLDIDRLLASCPPRPITRFAPSPTGHLHLGHVLSLLYVYSVARLTKATLLLRIEDHDRERCRDEYETSILEDIRWLGVLPDNIEAFRAGAPTPYRQSDNLPRYLAACEALSDQGRTYYCRCSRKAICKRSPSTHPELRYPGTCRDLNLSDGEDRGLRLRFDEAAITFDDILHLHQEQCPVEQGGDMLLRDRHGNYTYNFAVVVDDIDQEVNLIVRGTDIIHCTGRQKALHQILGDKTATGYVHHPLLIDREGHKLSKRHRALTIAERRADGATPEELIGNALFSANMLPSPQKIPLDEVPAILTGKHPLIGDHHEQ